MSAVTASLDLGQIIIGLFAMMASMIGFLIINVLKGIKDELREAKITLQQLDVKVQGGFADLDRRVVRLEARCVQYHSSANDADCAHCRANPN